MSNHPCPIQDIGLSDQQVTELLDRLDAEEIEMPPIERRSTRRYLRGAAMVVSASAAEEAPSLRVRLRNVSRHGVAFLSSNGWEVGTRLRLELPIGSELASVEMLGVVVHRRHLEGPIFEIGAEFDTPCY